MRLTQDSYPANLEVDTKDTEEYQERDKLFDGFRIAKSEKAKSLVKEVLNQTQNFEKAFNLRDRARRPRDQKTFERQIEALICDAVYREIMHPEGWLSISFSKRILGKRDQYRSKVIRESLPDTIRLLARPEMSLLELVLGEHNFFNPSLSRQTAFQAGPRLLTRITNLELGPKDFSKDKTQEIIILKSSKESFWDNSTWLPYQETPLTKRYRDELQKINNWLDRADIQYIPSGPLQNPVDTSKRLLRRYFNNGSFQEGGRIFGGFLMDLPKAHRNDSILIDGEPVVTLDYKNMCPRILYGVAGEDAFFDDAYLIPGLEHCREGIKKVMGSMLHLTKPPTRFIRGTRPLFPPALSIDDVIKEITSYHEPVSPYFFTGIGLKLTYIESEILLSVLKDLIERGITGLPIHDALLVPRHHMEETKDLMLKVFRERTGIDGIVNLEGY